VKNRLSSKVASQAVITFLPPSMKRFIFTICIITCISGVTSLSGQAQPSTAAPGLQANDPSQREANVVTAARRAAAENDDGNVDKLLASVVNPNSKEVSSVLLARRAMAVCGWLWNDNEYGQAVKIARRAVANLASLKEDTKADRVERLYWEACLEGQILDRKRQAVRLLQAASALAPDDERILELELRWLSEVAASSR
jgi:hypothetical protein